jgi:hypothetical protein
MYLNANSRITIGQVQVKAVNEVIIETSVKDLEGKVTITLPRNFVTNGTKGITDFIKKGDKVTVELGYNGDYYTEFTGYVDIIGSAIPLVIECDNAWFKHKKNVINKSWASVTLKKVLQTALPGYAITCPDVNLGKFLIKHASSFETVKGLLRSAGFFAKLDEDNKKLECYWPYDIVEYNTHKYVFGTHKEELLRARNLFPNVKKNTLTFKVKDDVKIRIIAKSITPAGKHLKVEGGSSDSDAEKRTRNYGHEIQTESALKAAAEKDLKIWNYAGYRDGAITGFGYPRTKAGDTITIIDIENPEREGNYLIEKTTVRYSAERAFYERENSISYKV